MRFFLHFSLSKYAQQDVNITKYAIKLYKYMKIRQVMVTYHVVIKGGLITAMLIIFFLYRLLITVEKCVENSCKYYYY